MATLEQQAAQEFRKHLQRAWDRQRAIEQTILSFVDTPRKGVKAYLEAVQDAATEVTRDQVRINYGNLEFDTNKESVSQ